MGATLEMSAALQVALIFASVALIVLVVFLIPLALQVRRQFEQLALSVEQSKAKLEILVQDSGELFRNVTDLSQRANQQMDSVGKMVNIAQQWTERADRIVNEVGSAIEPPRVLVAPKDEPAPHRDDRVSAVFISFKSKQQPNKTGER
jgi:uncharacterized protein YoxC